MRLTYIMSKNAGDIFVKFLLEKIIDPVYRIPIIYFKLTGSIASDGNERTII
ncbi:putative EXOV-like protein [Megavirus courdo11]|uniref:Putative EXOV-like protein n=1 Tax=Megavirus courdo11 TaxID=1128140 RepID=K7Y9E8_9VIRU|nr:putative EXOV-like protein [Megavirus courdo11]